MPDLACRKRTFFFFFKRKEGLETVTIRIRVRKYWWVSIVSSVQHEKYGSAVHDDDDINL